VRRAPRILAPAAPAALALAALALGAAPEAARADGASDPAPSPAPEPGPADAAARPKKDRERAGKGPCKQAAPRPGTRPARLVNLYNSWTHEWLAVVPGEPMPRATLDRFLRDHYTNQPAAMEPKLLDVLLGAARHFHSDTAIVVSAFRHPKYNLLLRKKGHQVARDSNHTKGIAVDFYIPKIDTRQLHAWAKDQKIGGVGLYLASQFVHMDTGPIRFWSGE
jgi:uncharacterized protein YcbK (DUF882 family)